MVKKVLTLTGCAETLAYTDFPMQHWTRIKTNNAIERLNREIRRRTRVVGTFPDGKSALMLVRSRADCWCKHPERGVPALEGKTAFA